MERLDASERLIEVALSRRAAEAFAAENDGMFVSKVSLNHATGDFVHLELRIFLAVSPGRRHGS
jgi:hypothetical protein